MSDVGKDFVHWVQQWRFSLAVVTSSLKLLCQVNSIYLRLLVQKNFVVSAPTRKITSIHIQVHIHSSLPTLLAKPLVEQGTCLG